MHGHSLFLDFLNSLFNNPVTSIAASKAVVTFHTFPSDAAFIAAVVVIITVLILVKAVAVGTDWK